MCVADIYTLSRPPLSPGRCTSCTSCASTMALLRWEKPVTTGAVFAALLAAMVAFGPLRVPPVAVRPPLCMA